MKKQEIITFKVDAALAEELSRIPNKSSFIRDAVLDALKNTCPLCQGTGILSEKQKEHWDDFRKHHSLTRCTECEEVVLSCDQD